MTCELRRLRGPTDSRGTPDRPEHRGLLIRRVERVGEHRRDLVAGRRARRRSATPSSVSQTAPGRARNSARAAAGSTGPTRRPGRGLELGRERDRADQGVLEEGGRRTLVGIEVAHPGPDDVDPTGGGGGFGDEQDA